MKILLLSPYLPLPSQGGGGTTYYYYLKNLARRYEIHLLCLVRPALQEESAELAKLCRSIGSLTISRPTAYLNSLLAIFRGGSFRLAYYRSRSFQELVRQKLAREHFDVVIASHERMGQYVPQLAVSGPKGGDRSTSAVIDLHDVVSDRHLMLAGRERNPIVSLFHRSEARRLHAYEIDCLKRFDAVWISTAAEAEKLREFDLDHRLQVTLRGIDLTDFAYGLDNRGSQDLLLTGHMSYEPNVDAAVFYCAEIHARVRELLPGARALLVGNFPHRRVLRAAHAHPGIQVTGRVPSVADYLRRSRVFVAPLRIGTGARIKLLEAMAVGIPIVSTRVGCEGLGVKDEEHLLIADRPDEFARSVKRLFDDQQLYERLSRNARKLVEAHYDLNLAAAEIETALGELMRGRQTPRTRASDTPS